MNQETKKILVVEDEESVASVLVEKLKNSGFEAEYVIDGKLALEKVKNNNFNLVLLDLFLPVMDGFEFLEKLKKSNIKIPVIVSSNLGTEEQIERVKNLGAKDYFVKAETSIEEIIERIKKFLG